VCLCVSLCAVSPAGAKNGKINRYRGKRINDRFMEFPKSLTFMYHCVVCKLKRLILVDIWVF